MVMVLSDPAIRKSWGERYGGVEVLLDQPSKTQSEYFPTAFTLQNPPKAGTNITTSRPGHVPCNPRFSWESVKVWQ